jgi:hypothetical protein
MEQTVTSEAKRRGITMHLDNETGLYVINGTLTASFMALRSRVTERGSLTWLFRLVRLRQPDLLLVG